MMVTKLQKEVRHEDGETRMVSDWCHSFLIVSRVRRSIPIIFWAGEKM